MGNIAELEGIEEVGSVALASIAGVLRLIGSGAGGPILMALGPGPLRTQQLTDRLNHLSPRSAYRHIGNLRDHGLVARQEEAGVPARVVLSLTDPLGRKLCQLLRAFASSTMSRLPRRGNGAEPWEALALLGDFWELGLIEELSHGPRSMIELAREAHPMTYHQVNRRAGLFGTYGLASSYNSNGEGKCFELTDDGRRCVGLIVGIGRWRQRYIAEDGVPGLTVDEMTTVLRAALPAIQLPEFAGKIIDLEVSESGDGNGYRTREVLQGRIGSNGTIRCDLKRKATSDASAAATINTWFGVLLDGNRGRVKVKGELPLIDACLTQLYKLLWEEASPATPASTVAGGD
jgi:DNA-binding HxlR family transcriptional regulator